MKHFFSRQRVREHGWSVLGPYDDAEAAQAARDAVAAAFPEDAASAVYAAEQATACAGIPAMSARVSTSEGEVAIWSDGFTELLGA